MLVKINGEPQKSFEQFQETFRLSFGGDLTPNMQKWLRSANFSSDSLEQRDSTDGAGKASFGR